MANHIVQHIDGLYKREFKTGRSKLPVGVKSVRRNITLSPKYDIEAESWKNRTGMSFSAWVELKMCELIHTETV